LRAAHIRSTGGTSIACVIEHMSKHRVQRAVMLTDGAVGRADDRGGKVLQRVRLGVALTSPDDTYNDLTAYTDYRLILTDPSHD
jgi:hypothetical protein